MADYSADSPGLARQLGRRDGFVAPHHPGRATHDNFRITPVPGTHNRQFRCWVGTTLWSVLELDLERREAGGGMGEPIDLHYPK